MNVLFFFAKPCVYGGGREKGGNRREGLSFLCLHRGSLNPGPSPLRSAHAEEISPPLPPPQPTYAAITPPFPSSPSPPRLPPPHHTPPPHPQHTQEGEEGNDTCASRCVVRGPRPFSDGGGGGGGGRGPKTLLRRHQNPAQANRRRVGWLHPAA